MTRLRATDRRRCKKREKMARPESTKATRLKFDFHGSVKREGHDDKEFYNANYVDGEITLNFHDVEKDECFGRSLSPREARSLGEMLVAIADFAERNPE